MAYEKQESGSQSAQAQTPSAAPAGAGAPLPPVAPVPPPAGAVAMDPKEVEAGKTFAILSYVLGFVSLPFFIVPLISRDNEFSLYHAKQCLLLCIMGVAAMLVCLILTFVCIGVFLMPIVGIGMLVLTIMGLMNAINGVAKPVPLVGNLAEQWFKGITKKV